MSADPGDETPTARSASSQTRRIALPAWVALIVALGALVGWLGYGEHQRQAAPRTTATCSSRSPSRGP